MYVKCSIRFLAVLIVFSLMFSVRADITSGLVGHWAFDSNFGDTAGVANNGTPINGASITTADGNWIVGGGALQLNGINQYVSIPDHIELDGNGSWGAFTMSAFIKSPDWGTGGNANILAKALNGQYRFAVNNDIGTLWALLNDGTGAYQVPSVAAVFNTNQWYHVAVTIDFGSAKEAVFYVDGSVVGTQPVTEAGIVNSGSPLYIGAWDAFLPDEYYNGYIDDVRIYNRTLVSGDIEELYQQAVPEPASIVLVLFASAGFFVYRRLMLIVDRKSLFRRLGHSPREVVLESGFMGKGVVEAGVFVKDGGLPLRGMPRTGRYDRQKDKNRPSFS